MKKKWLRSNLTNLLFGNLSADEERLARELLDQNPAIAKEFEELAQIYSLKESGLSEVPEHSAYLTSKIMAEVRELPERHQGFFSKASSFRNLFLFPLSALGVCSSALLAYFYFNLPPEYQVCMPSSSLLNAMSGDSIKISSAVQSLTFIFGGALVAKSWQLKNPFGKILATALLLGLLGLAALRI